MAAEKWTTERIIILIILLVLGIVLGLIYVLYVETKNSQCQVCGFDLQQVGPANGTEFAEHETPISGGTSFGHGGYCTGCGASIRGDETYCTNCGKRLRVR